MSERARRRWILADFNRPKAKHAWIEGALKDAQAENDRIWAEVEKHLATIERMRAERREDAMQELTWQTEAEENYRRAEAAEAQLAAVRRVVVRHIFDDVQIRAFVRKEDLDAALAPPEPARTDEGDEK